MRHISRTGVLVLFCSLMTASVGFSETSAVGIFTRHGDVGNCAKAGSVNFDPVTGVYQISGGGDNMWATNDDFQYVWKRMEGDLSLAADIRWPNTGGNAHKKACLVIRQSLDPDSAYADAAFHGNGWACLQSRDATGGVTREIISNVGGPQRLRIERHGNYMTMSVALAGEELGPAGGALRVELKDPFYVGLAVCAHDNKTSETAVFSNVEIKPLKTPTNANPRVASTLEVVPVASTDRRVIYHTPERIEAPNWSPDGKFFIYNSKGLLYKLPVTGGRPEKIDTGSAVKCNNDHGLSPDGTQIAISDQTEDSKSRVYVLPITGGAPKKITPLAPSYWHGWSPDGKTLAYCAQRNNEYDVYTMPAEGGEETRLTTAAGLDDGPDYSPDGKYIYFNSDRTGWMQIWRMKADGSEQEQITTDDYANWFAHPSPDGKWIVFLSYDKSVKGHPPNQDVLLRAMPVTGGNIRVLAKLFGGQGTLNVPSWSPDSKEVAFVSYQFVYP